jgi:osmotically-inducible protein OsmY
MMRRIANRPWPLVILLAGVACLALFICSQVHAQRGGPLNTIVVTGQRPVDSEMQQRVEAAMRSDPFFFDGHVTVTVRDGVVTLQGMVFDEWDLRMAKRIAARIPGVKHVTNDLEIEQGGD